MAWFKRHLRGGLVACGMLLLGGMMFAPSVQASLSVESLERLAKERSVRIESSQSGGTGVLVHYQDGQYTVLTAAHVVEDQVPYQVITADQSTYQITPSQIQVLPQTDLALFSFQSSKRHPIAILGDSTQLPVNSACFTFGFPTRDSQFSSGQVVANVSQPLSGGEGLGCSAASTPGMSGGPILNPQGHLVGINTIIYFSGNDILFTAGVSTNRFLQLAQTDSRFPPPMTVAAMAPQRAEGYLLLGRDQANQEQHELAVDSYSKALALNPNSGDAYVGLGLSQAKLGNYQGALQSYNQAIAINPMDYIVYYNRAIAQDRLGLVSASIADYNLVLSKAPSFALAYHNRGNLYARQENYPQALADLSQAIAISPRFFSAYYNRGNVYKKLNNLKDARLDYETAVALNPQFSLAYMALGHISLSQQQWDRALKNYEQASRLAQVQKDISLYEEARMAIQQVQQNR